MSRLTALSWSNCSLRRSFRLQFAANISFGAWLHPVDDRLNGDANPVDISRTLVRNTGESVRKNGRKSVMGVRRLGTSIAQSGYCRCGATLSAWRNPPGQPDHNTVDGVRSHVITRLTG